MRLFNRRKEMEFDDPRLVGMAPLESFGESSQSQQTKEQDSSNNMSATMDERRDHNFSIPTLKRTQQPDKHKMTNAAAVSTWKRVARPWDSLRRSESSEQLSRSVISNRRKTLHFYPEPHEEENVLCGGVHDRGNNVPTTAVPSRIPLPEKKAHLIQQQQSNVTNIPNSAPTKRKIGRVESLRLLLSKSNRIYRGKFNNSTKIDKGTSTQDDLENLQFSTHNHLHQFTATTVDNNNDDVFHSKYSSISSLKSDILYSSPLSATNQFRSRYSLTKATSCENISLQNINQGRTLPGYRDMSTSTTPFLLDSSCFSPQSSVNMNNNTTTTSTTNTAKRSSFPYAYIRSRLSSLQEEPKKIKSPIKPPRVSINTQKQVKSDQIIPQHQNQQCSSVTSNFIHKGFYHSMGNLLSETKEQTDHSSPVDGDEEEEEHGRVDVESICRIFDPLKQIRIDLLHGNPSELDEQSPSPTSSFWGRRSYSIGDILLEKRKVGKSDSGNSNNGIEESGYDSDSTRTGHESPRNSVKSPSSETENESNEREQCAIKESTTNNRKFVATATETDESLDSHNDSESSSSSSSCSFPASGGCLITINQTPTTNRTQSVNGFRKGDDGSIIEVTSEIDQSEDADFYSVEKVGTRNSSIESSQETKNTLSINYKKSSSNVFVGADSNLCNKVLGDEENREKSVNTMLVEPNKETCTTSLINNENETSTNDLLLQKSSAPSLRLRNRVRDKDREWNSINKTSRTKSLCLSIFTVNFNKGPKGGQKRNLGFSIIGGVDSPVPGIFIKRIFPYGQAAEDGSITEGDEILSVNGQPLTNSTHAEALNIFKSIKKMDIILEVARREFLASNTSQTLKRQYSQLISSKSCEQLHKAY